MGLSTESLLLGAVASLTTVVAMLWREYQRVNENRKSDINELKLKMGEMERAHIHCLERAATQEGKIAALELLSCGAAQCSSRLKVNQTQI